jgi:hypothetical protein
MPPPEPGTENKGTPPADGKTGSSLPNSLPPLALPQTTPALPPASPYKQP